MQDCREIPPRDGHPGRLFHSFHLGKFDAVCLFQSFGMSTDQKQRSPLRRIAEWLAPGGVVIMDVYHPFKEQVAVSTGLR